MAIKAGGEGPSGFFVFIGLACFQYFGRKCSQRKIIINEPVLGRVAVCQMKEAGDNSQKKTLMEHCGVLGLRLETVNKSW